MSQHLPIHRSPTIADVAQAAGVSRMTVSKVLRGTGRISEATRERVLRIADGLGYVPNGLAGALASRTSRLVGVLIPSVSDQVYAGVLAGINSVLTPGGFTSLIGETFFDPASEARLVRMMLSMKPAGLILTGGLARTAATEHLLRASGVRTVQLWDGDHPAFDATVGLTHREAGRMAARMCIEAGMRAACYIGAELQRDLCAGRRMEGYVETLRGAAIEPLMMIDPALPRTAEGGEILTGRLLSGPVLPRVIHYLNDAMATGGLRALHKAGIAVPERVAVIGFNGTALQHAVGMRIATIEVPLREVGERAARAVVREPFSDGRPDIELVAIQFTAGTTMPAVGSN